jgi:hypothetical protein
VIVCFPCLFIEYICNIEDHQEELGQGEGFVDQGQEQEQVAEGKPFIHAFPMHPCFYYLHCFPKFYYVPHVSG